MQDFGDETGDMVLRALRRGAKYCSESLFDHYKNHSKTNYENHSKTTKTKTVPTGGAGFKADERLSGYMCVPFGTVADTRQFLQICEKQGVAVIGLQDKKQHGFLLIDSIGYGKVEKLIPDFFYANKIDLNDFFDRTATIAHMSEQDLMKNLNVIDCGLQLSSYKERESAKNVVNDLTVNKTDTIAKIVAGALSQADSMDEFRDLLAEDGVRMDTSKAGEALFTKDFPNDQGEMLAWNVRGDTLKGKYGTDVTFDGLEMRFSDGSLDARGETADINQGIESHDGMDTNTSTLRIEREQSGSDVAPSVVRKSADRASSSPYSLSSEAKAARVAAKQLSKERGIEDRVTDISDKMNPQR
ncbi:hypothetical protein [Arcanobacterium hippocoleae]|uniref:Uncharacterized protein n=1 Tax=Arcanobacterium hippocoleae TaxID=149017 RepID=A0ABU1T1R1_9ACTO|nr:hypothetical protein [Arcanobacterium hippocoleae]MDR6939244.1 hypothetical protein [Arcanobacterium hippocoleae]